MKVNIECSEKEALLMSKALDLYCRIGLGQFWYLTDCNTVQKNLWKSEDTSFNSTARSDKFRRVATELSNVYTGHSGNASYGIFSPEVGEDCKIAAHLHQQLRHEFWKQDENKNNFGVNARPADICQMANIPIPNFKIEINDSTSTKSDSNKF